MSITTAAWASDAAMVHHGLADQRVAARAVVLATAHAARLAVKAQEVVHPGRPGETGVCEDSTLAEEAPRMNVHQNARLTPQGRAQMVQRIEGGERVRAVARAVGVTDRTVRKWVTRWRATPARPWWIGPRARITAPARRPPPSSPKSSPCASSAGQHQIAAWVGLSRATVGRVLRACGLARLRALDPQPPIHRYERATPGELLHLDTKNSAGSCGPGIGSPAPVGAGQAAPAGSTRTSASMTPRAWPMWRCCPMNAVAPPKAFSAGRCAGSPPWACPSSA